MQEESARLSGTISWNKADLTRVLLTRRSKRRSKRLGWPNWAGKEVSNAHNRSRINHVRKPPPYCYALMERTRLRGAPNTASAGPIAVSIRLSNARLRVRGTADFARRIHSRIRIGLESTREGAIDATIRKSCFRAGPGINVAFLDLVSDPIATSHCKR